MHAQRVSARRATAAPGGSAPGRSRVQRPDVAAILGLQRTAGNHAVQRMLQRYKEIGTEDNFSRMSDDETLAVPMESNLGSKILWGRKGKTAQTVDPANHALQTAGSPIRLEWTGDRKTYRFPAVGNRKPTTGLFTRIQPRHTTRNEQGEAMTLPKDCGENTREVIGAANVRAHYAVFGVQQTAAAGYPLLAVAQLIRAYSSAIEQGRIDALVTAWNQNLADATAEINLDRYLAGLVDALTAGQRAQLAADARINASAMPDVAQGVVVVGGGEKNPEAAMRWQFHMAPVVVKSGSGSDYVTLENFNEPTGPARNTNWSFNMYGTLQGQSIHEQLGEPSDEQGRPTGDFGTTPTTLVISRRARDGRR